MSARLHTLSSGVRVVCQPSAEHETFALSLVIGGGARWEDAGRSGWSHLLEHMVFKGAGGRSAKALSEDIENVGGSINAATGYERTSYQVRALKGSIPLAVEVVADLVLRPTLNADELEREKGVIASEIAEAADTPDDRIFDLAQAQAFGDQPLGRPILGESSTLAPATAATVGTGGGCCTRPSGSSSRRRARWTRTNCLARVEAAFAGVEPGPSVAALEPATFRGGARARRGGLSRRKS
jgi:predicted Zn-dependent peptidase